MKTPIPHPDSLQPTGKQPIILFALSLIFALSILLPTKSLAQEKEAYVVVSSDSTTLTFYYDDQMSRRKNENNNGVHGITETNSANSPVWINFKIDEETNSITWIENPYTKVIFNASFIEAKPKWCDYWFNYCTKLTEIEGLENLKTEDVQSMGYMFYKCSSLTSLDVSLFNTDKVEDMSHMFGDCLGLTSLDVSHFNTDKVWNMSYMFGNCSSLTFLDVSHFNTENVIHIWSMFQDCSGLTSLDVSNFHTEKATKMGSMFNNCSRLTSINLSSFNTAEVTDMAAMFHACNNLTSLNFGDNFNTSKVEKMDAMFEDCNLLPTLDLSTFDTHSVTDMSAMFQNCDNLKVLDLRSFNTSKVTDMESMFFSCDLLSTIIVSKDWVTDNVKRTGEDLGHPEFYYGPFDECKNLIGNAGTTFSEDHTDVDYANADNGYLTKETYKIFYDFDGDGEIDDVNDYDWEDTPPQYFDIDNRNNQIKIPNLKNQKGKIFKGWSGTPITGLTTPTKSISIKPDDIGNRIYTAVWEEMNIKLDTFFLRFPNKPLYNQIYCTKQTNDTTFKISIPDTIGVTTCELSMIDSPITAECTLINNNTECEISLFIPNNTKAGKHIGIIKLFDNTLPLAEQPISIEITIDRNPILHLYKDVIFVNNQDRLYQGNGTYKWYHNDQEIPNANYQYLYEPNMSGKYKAQMITKEGLTVYSCPIDEGDGISKSLNEPVKTYPNPAADGQELSIEIMDFDPEASYTIKISNNSGALVKEIPDAQQISTIALPRGVYSGALISSGRKKGFKLMVK